MNELSVTKTSKAIHDRRRGWYRIRQFLAALIAFVRLDERALLVRALSDPQLLLFERMPRFDQRHCLDVYHTLKRAGYTQPFLLQAALLHDCGKAAEDGHTIPLLYYGLIVVMMHSAPELYQRAARHGRGLLRPFAIHHGHELRGVYYVEAAGSAPAVVHILRDYAEGRSTPWTDALRAADDLN